MLRRLRRCLFAAAAGAVLVAAAPAGAQQLWPSWTAPPVQFPGTLTQKNVPITMSDGTVLYADVLFPADRAGKLVPGRFPVILTHTPYNKNSAQGSPARPYLVQHGYVQVIADVRGTGSSEGV